MILPTSILGKGPQPNWQGPKGPTLSSLLPLLLDLVLLLAHWPALLPMASPKHLLSVFFLKRAGKRMPWSQSYTRNQTNTLSH